jgi:hypothetical protein
MMESVCTRVRVNDTGCMLEVVRNGGSATIGLRADHIFHVVMLCTHIILDVSICAVRGGMLKLRC